MLRLFPSLVGWHHVSVRDRRTAIDFAHALRDLSDMHFPEADKITLVLSFWGIDGKRFFCKATPA